MRFPEAMSIRSKCILILSAKSSGSSALQALLCEFSNGRHVRHTRHAEYETLYWTKAASILRLPQVHLPDSEVPIPPEPALLDLHTLLKQNVPGIVLPADNRQLIFEGWRALCMAHAPVYVEKSPHHLHQWSCLQLMIDASRCLPDVDFHFIGLVRNPMDVVYSAWSRWRLPPEAFQHHWRTAYENLERLQQLVGNRLTTVRYEDFAGARQTASLLLHRLGMDVMPGADQFIHGHSRSQWRTDPGFGFRLDDKVLGVAIRFGYAEDEIVNQRRLTWPIRRTASRVLHRTISQPVAMIRRRLRRGISDPSQ
jgi:Sulfotransferase family